MTTKKPHSTSSKDPFLRKSIMLSVNEGLVKGCIEKIESRGWKGTLLRRWKEGAGACRDSNPWRLVFQANIISASFSYGLGWSLKSQSKSPLLVGQPLGLSSLPLMNNVSCCEENINQIFESHWGQGKSINQCWSRKRKEGGKSGPLLDKRREEMFCDLL